MKLHKQTVQHLRQMNTDLDGPVSMSREHVLARPRPHPAGPLAVVHKECCHRRPVGRRDITQSGKAMFHIAKKQNEMIISR